MYNIISAFIWLGIGLIPVFMSDLPQIWTLLSLVAGGRMGQDATIWAYENRKGEGNGKV